MGELELTLLRPASPEALIDEQAFEDDEFLPYWAELWPASLALAAALPARLDGVRVVELGCGLGGGYGGYNEDHEFFGYRQSI